VNYPKLEDIDKASVDDIVRWNRFLPSPDTSEKVEIINRIVERFRGIQQDDPGGLTAASKRVGW
jgi:hypothetical protein